ncbi:cytidine deaminase-like protein [Umbelopsis sp. PMI_123]|nr:cytidine deaminase-like protein [Umbelopsis sp. PMI_123]
MTYDPQYMTLAMEAAHNAYDSLEVPVGCVFVRNGEVLAKGGNRPNASLNATRHAEFEAIDEILSSHNPSIFRDTDLYVTVEPCIMCASALRQIGIRKVYFGCGNDKFGGNGSVFHINQDESLLTPTSIPYESEGGHRREDAIMLLRKFYIRENNHAPQPKKKVNRILKTKIESSS